MFKTKYISRLILIIFLLLSIGIIFSSCSTTKSSDQSAANAKLSKLRATKLYKEKKITIGDNYFSPKSLTIEPNTIVIFTNEGFSLHDVKDDKVKTNILNSEVLKSKNIYVALFTKEGEYGYHCHFHGGPKFGQYGTIIVKAKK